MIKPLSILPVLAVAALLAVGCGGSDSTLSKADFIAQADAICEKTDKTQAKEFQAYEQKNAKTLSTLSPEEAEEKLIATVGLPSVLKEAEELEALGVPKGEEKEVEAILTGIEAAVKKAEKEPESVEGDAKSPFDEVDKMAGEYGFKACAEVI
jgi:hypothetical protein